MPTENQLATYVKEVGWCVTANQTYTFVWQPTPALGMSGMSTSLVEHIVSLLESSSHVC